MTFEEAALLPSSEKVTLVTIDALQSAKIFTVHDIYNDIYSRNVDNFVVSVKENTTNLVKVNSLSEVNSDGKFFYSAIEKKLYVRCLSGSDPKTVNISITYRFFFSNAPLNAPYDFSGGDAVEWLPYINSVGSIGQTLDSENTGIVLESSSNIDLINTHGFFDSIYDVLIWENKSVSFYSWFPFTDITEARKIFDGVVDTKSFSEDKVTFKVNDFVFRLRDFVDLPLFTDSDGTLKDSLLDTPKRRIYGQVKQVKLAGIDNTLTGFTITGTSSVSVGSQTLTGVGTIFKTELSVGDELEFIVNGDSYKFGVESISSDTSLTINKISEVNIVNLFAKSLPLSPIRIKNRRWHVAGHKLREASSEIISIVSDNRFIVDTTEDLFSGDKVLINGEFSTIRRISGNEIVTDNIVTPSPIIGDTFVKPPIQSVFFGAKELVYLRDWTYENTTESIVVMSSLAEFNITQEKLIGINVTFTNNSPIISTSSVADFRAILKPTDWIKKNTIVSGQGEWYEILSVSEQTITLKSNYTGSTQTTTALIKQVDYIGDESLITCNCLGIEVDGEWVKTPSNVVRHLILNDAGFSSVNEDSFTKASFDCDYISSIVIPASLEGKSPQIREVISLVNESVFGSLYGSSSLDISYSILNSDKPETEEVIRDDDIISFSSETTTSIYNAILVRYRPFTDLSDSSDTFESIGYNSGFVDKNVGVKRTLEKVIYIYEEDKALIIAQRLALFNSLSNTTINIKAKLNLFLKSVNDKVFISLDRLFNRFGGGDKRKIGIVTSIKRGQYEVDMSLSDLGNIFNRVPSIAPNTTNDFLLASEDDKVKWGFVVDDNTLTPDNNSEELLNCNIIG